MAPNTVFRFPVGIRIRSRGPEHAGALGEVVKQRLVKEVPHYVVEFPGGARIFVQEDLLEEPGDRRGAVTEEEWLEGKDPAPLLRYVREIASDRKLRLFACACARRAWGLLGDAHRRMIEVGERYADGLVDESERAAACHVAPAGGEPSPFANAAAWKTAIANEGDGAWDAARWAPKLVPQALAQWQQSANVRDAEMHHECDLLRCIFGNPFRSDQLADTYVRTAAVIELAQEVYEHRSFNRMPEIAKALEAAGCRDNELVAHCRSDREHVRGCWVVDFLLGKK
jgi:hypothetical protein